MPETPTPRLSLYRPLNTGSELVNVQQDLNNNWDKVDSASGFQIVTSGTRPAAPYPGKPITESDTGRTYFSNGTSPASASWVEIPNSAATYGGNLAIAGNLTVAGIGQYQFIRKTADETVTNASGYQNDDQLVLPVIANAVYQVDGYIVYQTASAAGINLRMTGPSGTGLWTFNTVSASGGTTDTGPVRTNPGTNGTGNAFLGGSGTNMSAILRGTFLPTASGNLQFEWAQNTANATGTIVRANSWLALTRVG